MADKKHKHTLWSETAPHGPYYCERENWRECPDHKLLSLTVTTKAIGADSLNLKAESGSTGLTVADYAKASEEPVVQERYESRWIVDPRDAEASLAKAEKIVNRANKKGLEGGFKVWLDTSSGKPEIVLIGEPYGKNGWKFVASIERLPNGEALVKKSPYYTGPDIEQEFLEGDLCQHCNTHKKRKVQIVIENEEGHRMILGSTCVKDFLGWSYSPIFSIDPEELKEQITGGHVTFHEPIENVLAIALAASEVYGFQSASGADEDSVPTKRHVQNYLFNPASFRDKDIASQLESNDYTSKAKELIKMVEEDTADATGDYLRNMRSAFTGGEAYDSTLGLIVSSILMAEKKKSKLAHEEAKAATNASITNAIYAPAGTKVSITAQVVGQRDFETQYGYTTLYTFIGEGHRFKWFSSSEHGLETGETYTIKGTVKQEDTYKDEVSTVLTRCKVS